MQSKNNESLIKRIPENVKITFFRWWFAGAIYLLIGNGTELAKNDDPSQLILILGFVIGIATILIFNSIVYGMFECKRKGVILNKKWKDRNLFERVITNLGEIFKSMLTVFVIYYIYQIINIVLNSINNTNQKMYLGVEPILFGIFFIMVYGFFTFIVNLVRDFFQKRNRHV